MVKNVLPYLGSPYNFLVDLVFFIIIIIGLLYFFYDHLKVRSIEPKIRVYIYVGLTISSLTLIDRILFFLEWLLNLELIPTELYFWYDSFDIIFLLIGGSVVLVGSYKQSIREKELRIQEKRLRELQDHFIAITSHELRTPLTVIKGLLEFLNRASNQSPEKTHQISALALKNVNRLENLIRNVHDISRIQRNIYRINRVKLDMDSFARSIQSQLFLLYPHRLITVDVINITYLNPLKEIYVDTEKISQVLHNLISNSIKNSSNDSIIEVSLLKEDEGLRLIVVDKGRGIPSKVISRLFQPFVHISSVYSSKGTGLGLHIVKQITDAHNGVIEIFTGKNIGTTFSLFFPSLEKEN